MVIGINGPGRKMSRGLQWRSIVLKATYRSGLRSLVRIGNMSEVLVGDLHYRKPPDGTGEKVFYRVERLSESENGVLSGLYQSDCQYFRSVAYTSIGTPSGKSEGKIP